MSKKMMNIEMTVRNFVAQDILTASVIGVSEHVINGDDANHPVVAGAQNRQAQPVNNNHPLNH